MFRPTIPFAEVPSYFWWNESTLPSDIEYNSRWGTEVSYCCSAFYYPGSTYDNLTLILSDPLVNYTVSRSAHMDTVFPQMTYNNVEVAQIEIGFAQTSLLRRYPAINSYRSRDYDPTTYVIPSQRTHNKSPIAIYYCPWGANFF
jgi:hypothetical protein